MSGHGVPHAIAVRAIRIALPARFDPARAGDLGVELGVEDIVRLAAGVVEWPELLSSGRMSMTGDPFLVLRFPSLFRLPAGSGG